MSTRESKSTEDALADLLGDCAAGDKQAFEKLYRRSSGRLYAMCLALVKSEALAEEVLQESFVKIWHRAGSYDANKGSVLTWMMSIVRHRALDLLRNPQLQVHQDFDLLNDGELADFAFDKHGPATQLEIDASASEVYRCMEQLKETQKQCIIMAYCYGYSHDEMASLLKTPLGTVKAWIRRGIKRIRECLG